MGKLFLKASSLCLNGYSSGRRPKKSLVWVFEVLSLISQISNTAFREISIVIKNLALTEQTLTVSQPRH